VATHDQEVADAMDRIIRIAGGRLIAA
jgi:ABC-type lipoprotein export system ATPase subunit